MNSIQGLHVYLVFKTKGHNFVGKGSWCKISRPWQAGEWSLVCRLNGQAGPGREHFKGHPSSLYHVPMTVTILNLFQKALSPQWPILGTESSCLEETNVLLAEYRMTTDNFFWNTMLWGQREGGALVFHYGRCSRTFWIYPPAKRRQCKHLSFSILLAPHKWIW